MGVQRIQATADPDTSKTHIAANKQQNNLKFNEHKKI